MQVELKVKNYLTLSNLKTTKPQEKRTGNAPDGLAKTVDRLINLNILALKGEVRQNAGVGTIGETYTFIQLHSHIPIKPSTTLLVFTLFPHPHFSQSSLSACIFLLSPVQYPQDSIRLDEDSVIVSSSKNHLLSSTYIG